MEITLELTKKCPLWCGFCSSDASPKCSHYVSQADWIDVVDQTVDIGGKKICLSGGEPLMYPGFLRVLEHVKRRGLMAIVYTTGIVSEVTSSKLEVVGNPLAESIAALADEVVFGIHGPRTIHDRLTGVLGSFDLTMDALRKIRDLGARCSIHTVPLHQNIPRLAETVDIALNERVNRLSLLRFVPQGRGLTNRTFLEPTKYDLALMLRKLRSFDDSKRSFLRLGAPFSFLGFQTKGKECTLGCRMTILPDGTLAICEAFKQLATVQDGPNVFDESLQSAWNCQWTRAKIDQARQMYSELSTQGLDACPAQTLTNAGAVHQVVTGEDYVQSKIGGDVF
ncbi:MAG: radical SAM protein [Candidatus Thorarchaeota archaeon]